MPIYGQTCNKYMVKIQEDPLQNSHGYDVSIVNCTDVTSTESQPESVFANKIHDHAHKRTPTIHSLCSLVHGPAPFRAESGDMTILLRSYMGGLVRETRYNWTLYCMVLKQYGKHE